jgi:xylulokinase
VTTRAFRSAPETLVHAFCHALPGTWFQMAAMLNGASCLAWAVDLVGDRIETLLAEAQARFTGPANILFLPYLTGERTPHNDPHARGVFFGLSPATDRVDLIQAVLEGVAFSFVDAKDVLAQAGTPLRCAGVIGGGAPSAFWTRILASALGFPLTRYDGGDKGPAFGAARLARLAVTGERAEFVCMPPPILDVIEPDPQLAEAYAPRVAAFRRLYQALKPEFQRA